MCGQKKPQKNNFWVYFCVYLIYIKIKDYIMESKEHESASTETLLFCESKKSQKKKSCKNYGFIIKEDYEDEFEPWF